MRVFKIILDCARRKELEVYIGPHELGAEFNILGPDGFKVDRGYKLKIATGRQFREFLERAEQAKIFMMENRWGMAEYLSKESQDITEPFDMPFQTCSFEALPDKDGYPVISVNEAKGSECSIVVIGVLVHELSPGIYDLYSLQEYTFEGPDLKYCGVVLYPSVTKLDVFMCSHFVKASLDKIGMGAMGVETVKEVRKNASRHEKKHPTIRYVIRCAPKSKRHELKPLVSKKIDWSHRWCVRGHWRDIGVAGIGKDRDGKYCVSGKTWVVPFEKGPKSAPLVSNKVRIFTNGSTHEDT